MRYVRLVKQYRFIVALVTFTIIATYFLLHYQQLWLKFCAWMMNAVYIDDKDVIFQKNNHDCGPSALLMIFRHYNIMCEHDSLLTKAALNSNGTSMWHLKTIAEEHGLQVTARLVRMESVDNQVMPLLLYLENSHFVVLDSVAADYAIVRDPQLGRVRFRIKNLGKIWRGKALIFSKKG